VEWSGRWQLRRSGWRVWRCPGPQTQVREDLLDYRLFEDRGDDLWIGRKLPVVSDGNWPQAAREPT